MALAHAQYTTALKEYYLDPLNEQFNRATVLLDRIDKTDKHVEGRFAYVPLISTRNAAIGPRADTTLVGPSLPAAGNQGYEAATYTMAYHYGRASISGPVMRASQNKPGAFAKALDKEMSGLVDGLPEDLNRYLWSFGHGRAASIQANSAVPLVTCFADSYFNVRVGDRIHANPIAGAFNPDPNAGTVVTAVNKFVTATLHTVTTAATVTSAAATDALYYGIAGATGVVAAVDSSWAQSGYGIPALVDDGAVAADEGLAGNAAEQLHASIANVGGIARAANGFWQSRVLQNPAAAGTNRPLTVALLEQAFLQATTIGGAKENNLDMYTEPGLWATIGLLHIGDRRFNDYKETIQGGWIALMFNGRPIFKDRDCILDAIWFLDMSTLYFMTQSGYEFMEDGSVLSRVANTDAYEFTLYRDWQSACSAPERNVKLDDCTSAVQVA